MAAADSGCTSHFISDRDIDRVDNIIEIEEKDRKKIFMAAEDSEPLETTHMCKLRLQCLPEKARDAYIVPGLTGSLLSISRLCENGLKAIFSKESVEIWDSNVCILKGKRKPGNETHLWMINIEEEYGKLENEEVTVNRESCAMAYQTKINLETDRD